MQVKNIIEKYLEENNYDGLCQPGDCACKFDDIIPCGEDIAGCEPGKIVDCATCDYKSDDGGCSSGFDFCIKPI